MGLPLSVGLASKALAIPAQRIAGIVTLTILGLQVAALVVLSGIGFAQTAIQ